VFHFGVQVVEWVGLVTGDFGSMNTEPPPLSKQLGDRLSEGENRHGTTAVVQEGGFRIDT